MQFSLLMILKSEFISWCVSFTKRNQWTNGPQIRPIPVQQVARPGPSPASYRTWSQFENLTFNGCMGEQDRVENILKGCLDSILSPSPSVKIQIMGGKVCLRCKGKTLLGVVNKLLKTKSF